MEVGKRHVGYAERAKRQGKSVALYKITRSGASHTRRERIGDKGGKPLLQTVTYGLGPGKVSEILLTEEGAKALNHMNLVRIVGGVPVDNPVTVAKDASAEKKAEAVERSPVKTAAKKK